MLYRIVDAVFYLDVWLSSEVLNDVYRTASTYCDMPGPYVLHFVHSDQFAVSTIQEYTSNSMVEYFLNGVD